MIWNIDPVLLELGPLEIRYYGIFFALGLLLAYTLGKKMCRIQGRSVERFESLVLYLIIGLVVGARLGHILFYNWDFYSSHPAEILQVWNGGLSSHGAAIGVLAAYGLFLWRNKGIRFFDYSDIISIVTTFPILFVRLGNFFNSEIVGRPTDLPWAVTFPQVDQIPRHPSQLYESALGLLILLVLYPLWRNHHKNFKPGFFTGLFLVLYFSTRFLVEFVKEYPLYEGLTTGQWLSIPFMVLGLSFLALRRR